MKPVRTLYNILFSGYLAFAGPYSWLQTRRKGNRRAGFRQRFGIYDSKLKQALTNRDAIWIHVAGASEVNVCTQFIRALEPRVPNLKIVVSATTTAGMSELLRRLPSHISKIYYPFDRWTCVSRALTIIRPMAVVLLEADLWPNFIWRAQDGQIPVFLVNSRLAERSWRIYRRFAFLFRPLFASLTGAGAQDAADAQRLRALGCRPERIQIVGSLESGGAKLDERRWLDVPTLLRQFGMPPEAALLVGGLTEPGEEAFLAEVCLRLRSRFPKLFLVLAPRQIERSREIGRELQSLGLKPVYRNEITSSVRFQPGQVDCLLLNTTGELRFFYEHATVVFLGQCLAADGGRHAVKPGGLGKAMVFGPIAHDLGAVARGFLAQNAALQARDGAELAAAMENLLEDEPRRLELSRNALTVARQNLSPIDRTVDMVIAKFSGEELFIKSPRAEPSAKAARG